MDSFKISKEEDVKFLLMGYLNCISFGRTKLVYKGNIIIKTYLIVIGKSTDPLRYVKIIPRPN